MDSFLKFRNVGIAQTTFKTMFTYRSLVKKSFIAYIYIQLFVVLK